MRLRTALVAATAAAALVAATPGQALTVTTTTSALVTSFPGATTEVTFDAPDGALVASRTGGTLNGGSNPGTNQNWGSVGDGATPMTIVFAGLLDYVGLRWGTPDGNRNIVQLLNGATPVGSVIGNFSEAFVDIAAASSLEYFDRIVISSTVNWFEFDNIAARLLSRDPGTPVPAPGGLPLVLGALGLLGLAGRRKA